MSTEGQKPITAELGCVSPYIVVPGPWKPGELHAQAVALATWFVFNHGCNCCSPRVLIQHRQWPLRESFLRELGTIFAATPTRPAFYPGVVETYATLLANHPEARRYGAPGQDDLAWAVIPDLDPAAPDDVRLFRHSGAISRVIHWLFVLPLYRHAPTPGESKGPVGEVSLARLAADQDCLLSRYALCGHYRAKTSSTPQ